MKLVTQDLLDTYLVDDSTTSRMEQFTRSTDEGLTCQRWLRESAAKRLIFEQMYGDLFDEEAERLRILDVGGGLTCFTRALAKRHEYSLLDILAHDDVSFANDMVKEAGYDFIHPIDWFEYAAAGFDLVLANDIFPNVDQRFEIFLKKFLPQCRRLKVSLSWYDNQHFYKTKRLDGEEILFLLAWDSKQLEQVLKRFSERIVNLDLDILHTSQSSLYNNGRQVCIVEFVGELDHG